MSDEIKKKSIRHVAIIMDGNGRWATERAHVRVWGHIRGARVVSQIVKKADSLGVEALTLYSFSTENWSRPLDEITTLLKILKKFIISERTRIIDNNIRFKIIGDISNLPSELRALIKDLEDDTAEMSGLKLTFAFGYGGRSEILWAVNRHIKEKPGSLITEEDFAGNLMFPEIGDVDLLIRTGGDQRVSNFLLWQIAYAELYFTKTKWPDFTQMEFQKIIEKISGRERRFGAISKRSGLEEIKDAISKNRRMVREIL